MCNYFKKLKIKSIEKKLKSYQQVRLTGQPSDADIEKETALHIKLAKFYEKLRYKKAFPHAESLALESYRNAAALENAEARYHFASALIEKAKFWHQLAEGNFACKAHEKYAQDAFDEGFIYLKAAIEQGYPLAKRLYGLAYISGWGVEQDQQKGFELVIQSIEDEGAWEKATQIFQELGLNRPEFFSYMSSRQKKDEGA